MLAGLLTEGMKETVTRPASCPVITDVLVTDRVPVILTPGHVNDEPTLGCIENTPVVRGVAGFVSPLIRKKTGVLAAVLVPDEGRVTTTFWPVCVIVDAVSRLRQVAVLKATIVAELTT